MIAETIAVIGITVNYLAHRQSVNHNAVWVARQTGCVVTTLKKCKKKAKNGPPITDRQNLDRH